MPPLLPFARKGGCTVIDGISAVGTAPVAKRDQAFGELAEIGLQEIYKTRTSAEPLPSTPPLLLAIQSCPSSLLVRHGFKMYHGYEQTLIMSLTHVNLGLSGHTAQFNPPKCDLPSIQNPPCSAVGNAGALFSRMRRPNSTCVGLRARSLAKSRLI